VKSSIYHIAVQSEWARAAGSYRAPSLDHEGFIHCSTAEQVMDVANAFYRGRADLVLLEIDAEKLTSPVEIEAPASAGSSNDATTERFPHVYGPINTDAIVTVLHLSPGPDGMFDLPTL